MSEPTGPKPQDQQSGAPTEQKPSRTPEEIVEDIQSTRAELAATLEELSGRVSPQAIKADAVEHGRQLADDAADWARKTGTCLASRAKQAVADARTALTGGGLPQDDPARTRDLFVAAGISVAATIVVVVSVRRKRSSAK